VAEKVNGKPKRPIRNRILELSTPNTNPTPQTLCLMMPSGEYIKTYCEQVNRENVHVLKAIVCMLQGYSTQRCTIGSFSALGYLLTNVTVLVYC